MVVIVDVVIGKYVTEIGGSVGFSVTITGSGQVSLRNIESCIVSLGLL